MLKRNEAAHQNSYEHFPVFASAMVWAHVAGLDMTDINVSALVYTVVRLAYVGIYVGVDTAGLSQLRGLCWWTGNVVCMRLFWKGMRAINAGKA